MYYIPVEYKVINHEMPYAYKKTYRRKPAKKAKKPARRYKTLPALVKREIQKAAEVKRTNSDPQTYAFNANNATMSAPVDLPALFCSLANGPADGERIGEQVRTKKAILRMLIQAPIPAPAGEASILQLFIGYHKATPGTAPTAAQLLDIFDDGSLTAPANGTLLSLLRSINSDEFRIMSYKKLKIGNSTASGFTNNDFPAYRTLSIDLTKHLGLLKFPGLAVGAPTNKHFYMFCNWINPDGTAPDSQPPRVQYYLDFTYTDM